MKVRELIELLQKTDRPDADVVISQAGSYSEELRSVRQCFADITRDRLVFERDDEDYSSGLYPNAKLCIFLE